MNRGISSPVQGHFVNATEGVFAKTTSNSLPLWHFPHPDPLSRAILPGPCPVLFLVPGSLWGSVYFSAPTRPQGMGFLIVSVTPSGFRTVVQSLNQLGNPILVE